MKGLQSFLAGLALLAGIAAAAMIGGAGLGNRFGLWDYRFALGTLFQYGSFAAMGAGALGLLALVIALFRRKGNGAVAAVLGLLLAGGALYFPLSMRAKAQSLPLIADISTDTADAPAFVALAGKRHGAKNADAYAGPLTLDKQPSASPGFKCPKDPCPTVAEEQKRGYPDIATYKSSDAPAALFDKAAAAARDMGWLIVDEAKADGRIEATATTAWFGFKDDVVIRIAPDGAGAKLDIRSASRVGLSDVGANAERIRAFLAKVKG